MLLKPLAVSLILTLLKSSLENENDKTHLIDAIKHIIDTQELPVKISALLCWNKVNSKLLIETLSSRYNIYLNNIEEDDFEFKTAKISEHQLFVLDLNCNKTLTILKKANDLKLFRFPLRWILLGSTDNTMLTDLYFGVDSKVYLIDSVGVKTLHKYERNTDHFVETSLGVWRDKKIAKIADNFSFIRNRTNLNGVLINISIVVTHNDTLNHLWDYRDKHVDSITKLNYLLMQHLCDYLNVSKELLIQPTWGYKNATTQKYSGMVGDLQSELAEIGGTPLFFTMDRVDIIDYVAATTPTYMKFIFRAPPLSYVTNVFTLPFDTTVWHCSFIMVAVILLGVYVIVFWEWKDERFRSKVQDKYNALRPNLFDVFMMEIGAITQQGTDVEPKSISGRIATIFTFLTLMFMYTSYSANIVALLQSTTDSIKTLDDLLNSRIKLGVEDIVYAHYYFENAKEPIRKAIYEQKVAPKGQKPNFMTVQEGIKRVQNGFFAFHVELSTGYKVVNEIFHEHEKCGLKEIIYVNLFEPFLAIQKKSAYKEIIKIGMKKISESGIQKREINRIYTRKPVCHSRGNNFGSVGLIDCYSAFLIFAIGIAFAFILMLIEIIAMRCHQRQQMREVVTMNVSESID